VSRLAPTNFDMATCSRDSRELAHRMTSRSLHYFSNESRYGVDQNLCIGLYLGRPGSAKGEQNHISTVGAPKIISEEHPPVWQDWVSGVAPQRLLGKAPGVVLDVVGLVEDEDALLDVDVHGLADDGVNQVVVRAEHQVSLTFMSHTQGYGVWHKSSTIWESTRLCQHVCF